MSQEKEYTWDDLVAAIGQDFSDGETHWGAEPLEWSAIRRPEPKGGLKHGRCAATPLVLAVVGLRHVLWMRPPSLMFRGQRWPKFKIQRRCKTHPMLAHECLAPTAHKTRAVAAL